MSLSQRVMRLLLGHTTGLYAMEARVVEAIKSRLDHDAASRFQTQIDSVNRVQRLVDGKEVNFYHIIRGKPAFDDSLRFPGTSDEALLATVRLSHPEKSAKLVVEAWLANGRLFSLLFDKPPKHFFAGYAIDTIQPDIADVRIWLDPMHTHSKTAGMLVDPATLVGWLRDLYADGQLTGTHAPLSDSERNTFTARINAQLPLDYLEFVQQTEGARIGACNCYGLMSIRKTALPGDNYYVLAENDQDSALAVKDGSRTGELYRLYYDRDEAETINHSFQAAVAYLCDLANRKHG